MKLNLKIPIAFSLAGMNFNVKEVDNIKDGTDYGRYIDATNTIELAKRIKIDDDWFDISELTLYNTFYHELFHVFNYYWNTDFDEGLAQTFANFMVEYLQTVAYNETF